MSRKVSMCCSGMTSRWTSAFGLMSSIARSPSPRFTTVAGSSPASILQTMQSGSRSEDPLLRHRRTADSDELANRSVDEPRRVVVAVAAARAVDEDDVLGTDLLAPAPHARVVRERAQPRAPLLLHLLRHRVRRGGRRPRPRRVREDVHLGRARLLQDAQGVLACTVVLG